MEHGAQQRSPQASDRWPIPSDHVPQDVQELVAWVRSDEGLFHAYPARIDGFYLNGTVAIPQGHRAVSVPHLSIQALVPE